MFARQRRILGRTPRVIACILAIVYSLIAGPKVRGQSALPPITVGDLLEMSPTELQSIYQRGIATAIPEGKIRGTALLAPGTKRARLLSRSARFFWQGKVFEHGQNTAVNRFFGLRVIRGELYQGQSWLDGQPSLILDYSQTSQIYADNRDEIRQIGPGLYLGLMYNRTTAPPKLQMYFALDARH
jgi:hypothetical protein